MDLDAEMQKLQAEAQRRLRAKEEEEARLLAQEPQPASKAPEPESNTAPGVDLSGLANLGAGVNKAATLAKGVDQAKQAAEVAGKWTLLQKLGAAAAALVVFVVCWKLFLKTLVEAVLALAILILILVAIGKLLGWTKSLEKKDDA